MDTKNHDALLLEVIGNLQNLDQIMAYLESREDGSIFSLIRSNLSSDIDKLSKLKTGPDQ